MVKKVEVNNDKMAALQEALKKIEKDFGTGSVMRLDEAPELSVLPWNCVKLVPSSAAKTTCEDTATTIKATNIIAIIFIIFFAIV